MVRRLRKLLKNDYEFIFITLTYLLFCLIILHVYQVKTRIALKILAMWSKYSMMSLISFGVYCVAIVRPEKPLSYAIQTLRNAGFERVLAFFFICLCLSTVMVSFVSLKVLIPVINPFSWDQAFAHLDFLIHGNDPWKILYPYLCAPWVTKFLVVIYLFYFYAIFAGASWHIASPVDSLVRKQFLLSFALCWIILGNIMALVFSSAGPCFYQYVAANPQKYSQLMAYLHLSTTPAQHIVQSQQILWHNYRHNIYDTLFAISAMPSMHVSLTYLLVLSAKTPIPKIAATILTVLVSLACVHLGWHYAVDVYVAVLGTWIISKLVGVYVKWRP